MKNPKDISYATLNNEVDNLTKTLKDRMKGRDAHAECRVLLDELEKKGLLAGEFDEDMEALQKAQDAAGNRPVYDLCDEYASGKRLEDDLSFFLNRVKKLPEELGASFTVEQIRNLDNPEHYAKKLLGQIKDDKRWIHWPETKKDRL